jgi:hypothetical protein
VIEYWTIFGFEVSTLNVVLFLLCALFLILQIKLSYVWVKEITFAKKYHTEISEAFQAFGDGVNRILTVQKNSDYITVEEMSEKQLFGFTKEVFGKDEKLLVATGLDILLDENIRWTKTTAIAEMHTYWSPEAGDQAYMGYSLLIKAVSRPIVYYVILKHKIPEVFVCSAKFDGFSVISSTKQQEQFKHNPYFNSESIYRIARYVVSKSVNL